MGNFFYLYVCCFFVEIFADSYIDYELGVPCDEQYYPDNCNYPNVTLESVKDVADFDRCAPAILPIKARNLFWSAAGIKHTYYRNFQALKKIIIIPRLLRNLSDSIIRTKLFNTSISMPIGISPTSAHELANPLGEVATVRAAANHGIPLILSSASTRSFEDVAKAAFAVNPNAVLWTQTYITPNRTELLAYIKRAKNAKFQAIVVTIDSPHYSNDNCNSKSIYADLKFPNLINPDEGMDPSLTFEDLRWVVKNAGLPIIAKGVLKAEDALKVARTGVSAIIVSNQGGRQIDGEISTVEALADIVHILKHRHHHVDIYVDGGIRSGYDVFKVLALGAKAAFIGRPAVWGLAIGGEDGVSKVLNIMRDEFIKSMMLAGYKSPSEIQRSAVRLASENRGWN